MRRGNAPKKQLAPAAEDILLAFSYVRAPPGELVGKCKYEIDLFTSCRKVTENPKNRGIRISVNEFHDSFHYVQLI